MRAPAMHLPSTWVLRRPAVPPTESSTFTHQCQSTNPHAHPHRRRCCVIAALVQPKPDAMSDCTAPSQNFERLRRLWMPSLIEGQGSSDKVNPKQDLDLAPCVQTPLAWVVMRSSLVGNAGAMHAASKWQSQSWVTPGNSRAISMYVAAGMRFYTDMVSKRF